jgi:CubicO group peptidase (beta-lactamase class C family)
MRLVHGFLFLLLAPALQVPAPRATQESAAPVEDLGARIEAIRAESELPALGAALVTAEGGLQGVWVAGTRRAGGTERVTADDLWHLGSCTKSMTATLIALLVTRGDLSWDTPLGELLPELATDMDVDYMELTLVDLLTHRAGLSATPDLKVWAEIQSSEDSLVEQRARLTEAALVRPPVHPPRSEYLYSNDGFVIAGHIAEEAAGKPWETLIQELLFQPLGMTSAGFGPPGSSAPCDQPRGHTADGKPVEPGPDADNPAALGPAGTVHASLADWAKYVQLHLKGCREDVKVGEITLSKETFARLHAPFDGPGQKYAFGWVVERRDWAGGDGTALWHNGSNTMWYCVTWLGLANGVGALVTTNRLTPQAQKATDQVATLVIEEFQRRSQSSTTR